MASLHCTDPPTRPFLAVFSAKADLSLISAEVLYKGVADSKAEEKHPSSMCPHGISLGGHRDRESDMHGVNWEAGAPEAWEENELS